jgi:hypothetical protein
VFYQNPRDVAQELAAHELYTRDWRWHMQLRQWMQKDDSFPPPRPISTREERGTYVFWDTKMWRKDRVSDCVPSVLCEEYTRLIWLLCRKRSISFTNISSSDTATRLRVLPSKPAAPLPPRLPQWNLADDLKAR